MGVGCGAQLALKLFRDIDKKDIIAISDSLCEHVSLLGDCFFMKNPLESSSIVFLDETSAERFLPSLLKSQLLVICCNKTPCQRFIKAVGEIGYAASASIDDVEDFNKKVNKALSMSGIRYIEVLTPCPREWDYDASLTAHVAGSFVESGVWPLFEIENKRVVLGSRPSKLGVMESVHSIQGKYNFDQKTVESNWRRLVELSIK